jgi:hypothetical protein
VSLLSTLFVLLGVLVGAPARAQTPGSWVFEPGAVLEPSAVTLSGVGVSTISNPAVVYDTLRSRWFMVFEAMTDTVDARCPQGVWALGAAVSTDGINWTPFANAILFPTPGNGRFFSCVAAHPTAMYSPTVYGGAGGILVVFKAEQDTDACLVSTPSWGCATATGFGRVQIELNATTGDPRRVFIQTTPVHQPATATFGYPKVIQDAGTYRILYQAYPDIVSTSSVGVANFPAAVNEILQSSGAVPDADNEVFNPSFVCDDDPKGAFPYATFVGGRDTNGGLIVAGSWTKAIEATFAQSWLVDATPQISWTDTNAWRHWDVTKLIDGNYLVWFDEKDPLTGTNFIRFGGTTLTFNNADAVSRVCP